MIHQRISVTDLDQQVETLQLAKEKERKTNQQLQKEEWKKRDANFIADMKAKLTAEFIKEKMIEAKMQHRTDIDIIREYMPSNKTLKDLFYSPDTLKTHIESLLDTTQIRVTCRHDLRSHLEITLRWGSALLWPDFWFIYPDYITFFFIALVSSGFLSYGHYAITLRLVETLGWAAFSFTFIFIMLMLRIEF